MAITWLTEKGAKTLRSVAAFLCGAEWINETAPKWMYKQKVWEKSSNYMYLLSNVERVWFFLKSCCNHCSKRIEVVRSHRFFCGSSNERVCNRSVRTMEPLCACLIELNRFNILTWTKISIQLTETRLRKWGTLEFTILLLLTTKHSCSQFRARGRNGKGNIQTTGKRFNVFYMAFELYLNIWISWNTELQREQVNQRQFGYPYGYSLVTQGTLLFNLQFLAVVLNLFCVDALLELPCGSWFLYTFRKNLKGVCLTKRKKANHDRFSSILSRLWKGSPTFSSCNPGHAIV